MAVAVAAELCYAKMQATFSPYGIGPKRLEAETTHHKNRRNDQGRTTEG